jgi:hypothetical protein
MNEILTIGPINDACHLGSWSSFVVVQSHKSIIPTLVKGRKIVMVCQDGGVVVGPGVNGCCCRRMLKKKKIRT